LDSPKNESGLVLAPSHQTTKPPNPQHHHRAPKIIRCKQDVSPPFFVAKEEDGIAAPWIRNKRHTPRKVGPWWFMRKKAKGEKTHWFSLNLVGPTRLMKRGKYP